MVTEDKAIEDILVEQKVLNIEKIVEIKAEIAKLLYQDISNLVISEEALNTIPLEVAENYRLACFSKAGNNIKIGLTDPYNSQAIEAVNFLVKEQGLKVEYYLISVDNLRKIFNQYKDLEKEVSTALETKDRETKKRRQTVEISEDEPTLQEGAETAPVVRIVSVIIRHAVEEKASDIHIEPMQKQTRVRYRIDGLLRTSLILPKSIHASIVGRIKVLAKLKLDETRIPQDGRIRLPVNKKEIDFRISIMPLMGEEKVVMRILDLGKGIPKLEKLGYSHKALKTIKRNIRKTFGLFLVTGPTGSGKSTTLASVLEMLNKEDVNIATLEDPVEYYIKGANQSQIRPGIKYNFANGLRSLLRQDPDIIMVGEIRDDETAELSINAGLTGHFVLSTLHTNNAIDIVPRLIDMNVEPYLLGSTLNTVVGQRLVRKVCPNCKKKMKIAPDLLAEIKTELEKIPTKILSERLKGIKSVSDVNESSFYEGSGCPHCRGTGYKGRIAIVEIMDITDAIKEIIMDSSKILYEKDVVEDQGFVTMKQDGIIKALQEITTIQEVLRVIQD
jgi:type IV pilus assembly protein PilB